MSRNLTNLYISESFQYLIQVSGSELETGLGNTLTGSLLITASKADSATSSSYALSASHAVQSETVYTQQTNANQDHYVAFVATTNDYETLETDNQLTYNPNTNILTVTASLASNAISSSYAINANSAISSSYAATASYYNGSVVSASYAATATSASYAINSDNAISSSYAITASYALNAGAAVNTGSLLVTASAVSNVITFTKGDGSTFPVTVATGSTVSASYASTASLALNNVLTASVNLNTITFTKGDGSTFPITVNTGSAVTVNTGSLLVTASINNATTTFTKGDGSTFSITANNVVNANSASVATTASYALTALSSSYALNALSASYAPTNTTGSFTGSFTGSLLGTASFATNALSASYAPAGSPFPFTGSAIITGSLTITGSEIIPAPNGNAVVYIGDNANGLDPISIRGTTSTAVGISFKNNVGASWTRITGTNKDLSFSSNASGGGGNFNVSFDNSVFSGKVTSQNGFEVTGSARGNVSALTITSNTASLNCAVGNFFTLTLVSGSTTHVSASNILPGQTINLRVVQSAIASGSISFAPNIKQVSGSAYTPSTTANAEDIVTFIAFDSTNLYLSNIKNFI